MHTEVAFLAPAQRPQRRLPYWTLKLWHPDLVSFWSTPVRAQSPQRAYNVLRMIYGGRVKWTGAYRRLKIMPGYVPVFLDPLFHNFPKSPFFLKQKITPQPKPAPKPDAIDNDGRPLTFGMRVACWRVGEKPSDALRNLTLVAYAPESDAPYITDAGAFPFMLPDHQPDMRIWIEQHVTN